MMPIYPTMTGAGTAQILAAIVKDNNVISKISSLTKMNELNPLGLKDILLKFKIVDGKLAVEPFDVNAGKLKMNIGGTNSADGTMDYILKMDVPAGAVGAGVNNALSGLMGKSASGAQNLKLDFKIGGTYDNPSVSLAGGSVKEQATEMVKDKVKDEIKK